MPARKRSADPRLATTARCARARISNASTPRSALGCRASVWSARSLLPLSNVSEPESVGECFQISSLLPKRQQAARTPYAGANSEAETHSFLQDTRSRDLLNYYLEDSLERKPLRP